MFAALSTGMDNRARGETILNMLSMDVCMRIFEGRGVDRKLLRSLIYWYGQEGLKRIVGEAGIRIRPPRRARGRCEVCRGILDEVDEYARLAGRELSKYEFRRFTVGISVMP
jgi:tRNA U54 and U55 pseudouridine synthase Pus10